MITTSLEVPRRPPVWPQAHPITCDCGAYQAQAVLRAHGKVFAIPSLYVSQSERESCSTLPWELPQILKERGGLAAQTYYFFTDNGFLQIAKQSLEHGRPLVVLINATRGHHGLHWISLWGYDAKKHVFDAYDSQYPAKTGGDGNVQYSADAIESRFPWWITAAVEVDD